MGTEFVHRSGHVRTHALVFTVLALRMYGMHVYRVYMCVYMWIHVDTRYTRTSLCIVVDKSD